MSTTIAPLEAAPGIWRRYRPALRGASRLATQNALLLGLIALGATFSLTASNFLTVDNLRDVVVQSAVLLVVAAPLTFLLVAGHVDLSVGSALGLSGCAAGLLMNHGVNPVFACLLAVAVGAVIGLVNGVAVAVLGFSTIIVTLGMLTAARGLALVVAPNPVFDFPQHFVDFGNGRVVGIPYLVLVTVAVLALAWLILNTMPVGRHVFAIGVSRRAAFLSGVPVRRIGLLLFVITGAAAGLGGVMSIARLDSAPSASLGVGFELDVLTAVLLGGVAFGGGRGTILGVLLGALFLGVLRNGLTLLDVPDSWSGVSKGAVLIGAAALDVAAVRLHAVRRHTPVAAVGVQPSDPTGAGAAQIPAQVGKPGAEEEVASGAGHGDDHLHLDGGPEG